VTKYLLLVFNLTTPFRVSEMRWQRINNEEFCATRTVLLFESSNWVDWVGGAAETWGGMGNTFRNLAWKPEEKVPNGEDYIIIITIIIIIINIKDWTLWSVPSPELQLLTPTLLRSSNCSPSLWYVVVWFQRDSVLWHSLQVWKSVPSVFIYLV